MAPFASVGMKIYKNEHVPLFTRTEDGSLAPVWVLRFEESLYVHPDMWDVFADHFTRPIAEQHDRKIWQSLGQSLLGERAAHNFAAKHRPEGVP